MYAAGPHERGEAAVGLLDGPAQLAPQPHEQVDAHEVDRGGRPAVGIAQRGRVEAAPRIRVGQHEDVVERVGGQRVVQPDAAVERRKLDRCGVQPVHEAADLVDDVPALEIPAGNVVRQRVEARLISLRQRSALVAPQVLVGLIERAMGLIKEDAFGGQVQLVEQGQRGELRVDEPGPDDLDQLLVRDVQPARKGLGGARRTAAAGMSRLPAAGGAAQTSFSVICRRPAPPEFGAPTALIVGVSSWMPLAVVV